MNLALRQRITDAWRVLTTHPRLRVASDKRALDAALQRAGLSKRHAQQVTSDYFCGQAPAEKR